MSLLENTNMLENTNILENNIFKFLFFDMYLENDKGGYILTTLYEFSIKLQNFAKDNNITMNDKLTNFIEIFENNEKMENYSDNFIDKLDETTINNILDNKYIILASGWSSNYFEAGHGIMIYIEKIKEDEYNVFLINSGAGLTYQSNNIIIKYENKKK